MIINVHDLYLGVYQSHWQWRIEWKRNLKPNQSIGLFLTTTIGWGIYCDITKQSPTRAVCILNEPTLLKTSAISCYHSSFGAPTYSFANIFPIICMYLPAIVDVASTPHWWCSQGFDALTKISRPHLFWKNVVRKVGQRRHYDLYPRF